MLEEHKRIRAATETLRIAAREENARAYELLAETLAAHAETEEEVLYPALTSREASAKATSADAQPDVMKRVPRQQLAL
jgi:hypothetical protein